MKKKKRFLTYGWIPIVVVLAAAILFAGFKGKASLEEQVARLSREYRTEQIDRITSCSIREFHGITKGGYYTGLNQCAVSPDLDEYLGYYVVIPDVSREIFLVTDLTNKRFRKTIDIYTFLPAPSAKHFGVMSGPATFISPKGIKLLGEL